jgi:hypothetical protein
LLPFTKTFFPSLKKQFVNPRLIFWIFLLTAVVASLLKVAVDLHYTGTRHTSSVNNFLVFRNSFYHLIQHARIYGFMPGEQDDQFLYSPTFALFFAPFALLPKYVGVVVWCVFNSLILFYAIRLLPIDENKKAFVCWFIFVGLISTIQNVQSNPLVAALFILTFVAFERKHIALAALLICISFYIKIFGLMGGVLFLLYPQRLKFIGWTALWFVALFLIPLIVVSWKELTGYYESWYGAIQETHVQYTDDIFVSVMRMIEGIRGVVLSNAWRFGIQIVALGLFFVKFLNPRLVHNQQFRLLVLASIMIWCIIFNHAAESNHYVIASVGVALWYIGGTRQQFDLGLLLFAFILGASSSSLFPGYLRRQYVSPMALMALPFLLVWLKLEYELTISHRLTALTVSHEDRKSVV